MNISLIQVLKKALTMMLILFGLTSMSQNTMEHIMLLSDSIINDYSNENKLKHNQLLIKLIDTELNRNSDKIQAFDSSGLIIELISKSKDLQILTWAIPFDNHWEYFGFIKAYNTIKKEFSTFELIPTNFIKSTLEKGIYNQNNWPAGIYYKLIETEYKKRNYYTLIGWLANTKQTAYKFLEVLTVSKSGKISFGKSSYFSLEKEYKNRIVYSYNYKSKFQLDYGEFNYTKRQWNRKKKRYDIIVYTDNLLVFDRLIPLYPDIKDRPEFMVAAGNTVDAFIFEKGKWRLLKDVDARNNKIKNKKLDRPKQNLLPD